MSTKSPARVPDREAPDFVVQRALEQHVAVIELWVSDPFGALHVVEVPVDALAETLAEGYFAGPALAMALGPGEDAPELYLAPDPMSFQHVSRTRRSARLLCDLHLADGSPWPLCVRSRLKRVLGRVAAEGATFYLGATMTHRWLAAPHEAAPLSDPHRQQMLAEETALALDALATPWRSHRRVAGGTRDPSRWLFELDLVDPLTLADSLVTARRVAQRSAQAAGHGVTWMPHPWDGAARATLDLTVTRHSALEGPSPTFFDPLHPAGVSLQARAVMGALRRELGPLALVLRGTANSYTRPDAIAVRPSPMSRLEAGAAVWVAGADACSDPYLTAASVVAIAHDAALRPAPAEVERAVPETLVEAARSAEASATMAEVLGPELLRVRVERARADAASWRRQVTAFEVERHL